MVTGSVVDFSLRYNTENAGGGFPKSKVREVKEGNQKVKGVWSVSDASLLPSSFVQRKMLIAVCAHIVRNNGKYLKV